MDIFTKLFSEFLVFVYHCFDRIVIHGYLSALSRPLPALLSAPEFDESLWNTVR